MRSKRRRGPEPLWGRAWVSFASIFHPKEATPWSFPLQRAGAELQNPGSFLSISTSSSEKWE